LPEDPGAAVTPRPGQGRFHNQGVALVITLLLLFLLSVIGLAAVMSSSSDLMINGYYKNYRGSFYAADSGLNMARQAIYSYFNNQANSPAVWPTTLGSGSCATATAGTATYDGCQLASGAAAYVNSLYGNGTSYSLNNQGQAGQSVPSSFKILSATVTQPSGPSPNAGNTQWTYIYTYTLTSQGSSQGSETAQILEKGTLQVNLTEGSGTSTVTASFAAFGAYIDSFAACQGPLVQGYLTGPMYANGQWNLSSGSNPGYTFTDPVSQTGSQLSYYDGSNCYNSSAVPYTDPHGTTFNPKFESGYNLNAAAITLPPNDFSQKWAVLDGKGCGEGTNVCGNPSSPAPPAPTNAQMNALLMNVNQTAYPSAGATSGVYLPYTCTGNSCSLNTNAGGIYVEASGSGLTTTVTMSTTNGAGGSSNPSGQVFTIGQTTGSTTGSPVVTQTGATTCTTTTTHHHSGTTTTTTCTAPFQQATTTTTPTTFTTVTVDSVAATTTVSGYTQNANSTVTATGTGSCSVSGTGSCTPSAPGSFSGDNTSNSTSNSTTTTLTLNGVPMDLAIPPGQPATMVYVNGNVSISGPSSGAAIQNNSMVNLTANGDITQTGNILYATEPVTTSANQVIAGSNPACCNGDPIDTLIPQYENMNQVLGIFTANGNFILSPTTNGANIETDASVAMISQAGETNSSISHIATGNSVGTWTNIGGRMEDRAASVSMSSSNVYYDRRFQARTFAPPWFPSTSVTSDMLSNTITSNMSPQSPSRTYWQYQSGQ
jgi:hypothetical protein